MTEEVGTRRVKPVVSYGPSHVTEWTRLEDLRRCIGPCMVSITPESVCSSCRQATVLNADYIARRDG